MNLFVVAVAVVAVAAGLLLLVQARRRPRAPLPLESSRVQLYRVGSQDRFIGIVTGDLRRVRCAEVWVNSENTAMQMARFDEFSVSSIIHYEGARRDGAGRVTEDRIADELARRVAGRQQVPAGTAIVTGAGELWRNRVQYIVHVAAVQGEPGAGFRQIREVGRCVTNALAEIDQIGAQPGVRTVLFPLLGTGHGGGQLRPTADALLGAAIVVATHGVIDYDHVRTTANGSKLRQQFPSPSPRLVHTADLLKADELGGQRPWEQWLDPKRPPVVPGYSRPPDNSDVLFDSTGGRLRQPPRNTSGHLKGFPKLHHGLIGSGDRSFGDVTTRDQLATEHGFIALEMEATGIGSSSFLNGREWFVVRGVSDYGDGRRYDAWRRYASLAAAAYVRALLAKCLPLAPASSF